MEEVKFYVRCYDKIELARMYFPNLSNPVSVASSVVGCVIVCP